MYVVAGFEFQTKEEARQAKKESDGIRYIKDQTDMSDPDTVYKPVSYTHLDVYKRQVKDKGL